MHADVSLTGVWLERCRSSPGPEKTTLFSKHHREHSEFLMLGNNGWSYSPISNKNIGHAVLHVHVCSTRNTCRSMLSWLCNIARLCLPLYTRIIVGVTGICVYLFISSFLYLFIFLFQWWKPARLNYLAFHQMCSCSLFCEWVQCLLLSSSLWFVNHLGFQCG